MMKWTYFLWGLFIGAAVTLIVTGYYAWAAIGAIPIVGGIIKYKIKRKVGLAKPKRKSFLKYGKHSIR